MTTHDLVTALLVQVSLVPKKHPFEWHSLVILDGRCIVSIRTRASTVAIQSWFRKAGMVVSRFDFSTTDPRCKTVTFRVAEVVEES